MLGTGTVGQTLGRKLVELGHDVKLGSRSAGNEKAVTWASAAGAADSIFERPGRSGMGSPDLPPTLGSESSSRDERRLRRYVRVFEQGFRKGLPDPASPQR